LHQVVKLSSHEENASTINFQDEIAQIENVNVTLCKVIWNYMLASSIEICLCNIIDIGLNPVIQKITTIIAASLANTGLFGNYAVDSLFVLGNVFALPHESAILQHTP
jgi:hypothetical protein